jgi:hypothetical protein
MAIEKILNYIYTEELSLNISSIEAIIVCAQELCLEKLIKICEKCLISFEKKKILQVMQISRRRRLNTSFYYAYWYVCNNFDECIKLNYFYQLDANILFELIKRSYIVKRDETLLFEKVLNWFRLNKNMRISSNLKIIEQINFQKIEISNFLSILKSSSFIIKIPHCYKILKEIRKRFH